MYINIHVTFVDKQKNTTMTLLYSSIPPSGWPLWLEKLEKLQKGWFLRNQLEKLEKYIYYTTQAGKAGFFKMTTIMIDSGS